MLSVRQFARGPRRHARGFTLVELLVALGISMVVVIAAAYVYQGARITQRSLTEKAYAFESARFAMDILGRDIENAGFYPEIRSQTGTAGLANALTVEDYQNPVSASPPPAFDTPVSGCQAGRFLPADTAPGCADHSDASVDADTLIVNAYTNDASGLDIGNRADCLRQDAANDPLNSARRHANHLTAPAATRPFLLPQRPLFISNRYTLRPTAMKIEGRDISTFSLACNGNGKSTADNIYQPLIAGIDQLRFYFLVSKSGNSRFRRADGVGTDWPFVVAVRVCLLARSLEPGRLDSAHTLTDCDGYSRSFKDGIERRVFSQVFALKNQMRLTY